MAVIGSRSLGVLGLRDFQLLFGATTVSVLGDGIEPLAITFAVFDLTGSATDLGFVLAARTIALVASLLAGGVVADRVSRRRVMVAADVARLIAQLCAGVLLISGHASIAELAVTQAVLGAATGFFNPASSGLLPSVAGDSLAQANALRGMVMAAGNIVGPAVAGALVLATSPGVALCVDAATFAVSALLLLAVRRDVRSREPAAGAASLLDDLRSGFGEVRSRTWVWATIAALSIANAASIVFIVVGALIVKRDLGGASGWATILIAQGVGALIGGSALLRVSPRRPLLAATLLGLIPVLPTCLLAGRTPLAFVAAAALLAGAGNMVFNTLWETTLQRNVPEAARSRVSSYDWFGSLALQSAGYALVGPFAGLVGASTSLFVCGAVELVAVASLLAVREIRTLTAAPPPSEPLSGVS